MLILTLALQSLRRPSIDVDLPTLIQLKRLILGYIGFHQAQISFPAQDESTPMVCDFGPFKFNPYGDIDEAFMMVFSHNMKIILDEMIITEGNISISGFFNDVIIQIFLSDIDPCLVNKAIVELWLEMLLIIIYKVILQKKNNIIIFSYNYIYHVFFFSLSGLQFQFLTIFYYHFISMMLRMEIFSMILLMQYDPLTLGWKRVLPTNPLKLL